MFSKPVIGLNANFRSATHDRPAFAFLSAGYFDAISAAGGIPVVLPPLVQTDDLAQVLSRLDGMVLVGGPDLDPHRDGFMRHAATRLMEVRRENSDRALMKQIAQMRMPVFGIGVGMQLMNVSMGGNLLMHIPEDLPHALPHHDTIDRSHRHGLEVTQGTLMERIFGDGEVRVNSSHHMAIDELAPAFIASARCPDGVIEAIESSQEDWFAIGTQFHPEAESASALDQRIFEEFVEGVMAAKGAGLRVAA